MTLSPKQGVVEISTLWHFRLPLPIQMFIKVVFSPRLSGIGMPSPILWSHPLKMQRIVLLSSLLWWELGTNSLITGPGEWLSFRRFTSKLSWSWTYCNVYRALSWMTWLPGHRIRTIMHHATTKCNVVRAVYRLNCLKCHINNYVEAPDKDGPHQEHRLGTVSNNITRGLKPILRDPYHSPRSWYGS